MSRHLLAWLPAAAYMLLIWFLSSIPQQFSFALVPFRDKGMHFMEYATLAALLTHAARGSWPELRAVAVFGLAWCATLLWGLVDEIHQAYVPGRVADAADLLADAIGAVIGASVYLLVRASVRATRR